ncbi:NADPH-dependent FMN reductase [Brachybacterium sp. GCM10030267]|uniref:NADPH-dependent FMN reductase n=1 Tax=Brachybacterium sp. GCM10030267 TaxID=3273381 RepID=UPI00360C443F
MKLSIIIGSVRDGRKGGRVAEWLAPIARDRASEAAFEVIDLKEFDLPILTSATVPGAARKQYEDERVQRWSAAIDDCDGFVFVTPEYNHGVPGAFKNAFDSLGTEWSEKPVAFVSYGADKGIRAVEQWRTIISNFHMIDVRTQLALSVFTDFGEDGTFAPSESAAKKAGALVDDLVKATSRIIATR